MADPSERFPSDFVWGAATSSYQIEGAVDADGRGPSIWDDFCKVPGAISDGSDGAVACDHYHRMPEDVGLMAELGLQAYRFSVAWPRVLPQGRGPVNGPGLDFYDRLVDRLLAADIAPWITLYHWDLPSALGPLEGVHAPGIKSQLAHVASGHHLLLSHGLAVPVIRAAVPDARVGITLNLVPAEPASSSEADRDATERFDGWFNRWYLDPLRGRGYPNDMLARYRAERYIDDWSFIRPGDMETIAAPTDFLGVNDYTRAIIRSHTVPEALNGAPTVVAEGTPTDMGWEVYPDGLRQLLERVHRDYGPWPLYVTENGAAYATGPDADGRIADHARTAYLEGHIAACQAALRAGVPLKGYFAWSLMDNFEWAHGYEKRFGLVWVDYATQQRTPKDSALWYRDVIARGGLP
jgi:beta-glucosidase